LQLSSTNPSDAQPQKKIFSTWASASKNEAPISNVQGLTLILACRNMKKAAFARTELYSRLDAHIKKQRMLPDYDGHADSFRENLKIEIHYLDLAVIRSVFRFNAELSQKYPYVSHLICNAGVANFVGISWPKAIWQVVTDFIGSMTAPIYFLYKDGGTSVDGLGWVWQCNVFGHYCLFRGLQPLLSASKFSLGARVLWMSSLEASPLFYEREDWQLIKSEYSYAATKYQIDLIATHLDARAVEETPGSTAVKVRHLIVQPGVVVTSMSSHLVNSMTDPIRLLCFYLVRLLNSPHHTIDIYKAAISAVHLSLISLAFFPTFSSRSSKLTTNGTANGNGYAKKHSLCDSAQKRTGGVMSWSGVHPSSSGRSMRNRVESFLGSATNFISSF